MTERKLNSLRRHRHSSSQPSVKMFKIQKKIRAYSLNQWKAFINFSALLGYTKNVRQTQFSQSQKKPKKKSSRKIQWDNDRAANFQERKRQEEASALQPQHQQLTSSSPITSSSAPVNFSFAPPVDEQLNMQSPETLRQQSQDRSSLLVSYNKQQWRTCRGIIQHGGPSPDQNDF